MSLPIRRPTKMPGTYDDFIEAIAEFENDSPRGCVALGLAILEQITNTVLVSRMVDLKKAEYAELFKGSNPLSTMSARVKFLYALGLIDATTRNTLNQLREIRNEIAHADKVMTFETQRVKDLCMNLSLEMGFAKDPKDDGPRIRFIRSTKWMIITLLSLLERDPAPESSPEKFGE